MDRARQDVVVLEDRAPDSGPTARRLGDRGTPAARLTLAQVRRAQITYWTFGAIWPLVSMRTFEMVTGNKRDEWLVRTVALLMLSTIATLAAMPPDARDDRAMRVLGATSTAALGAVALIGPLVRRISKVYYLDAVTDLALAALWLIAPKSEGAG